MSLKQKGAATTLKFMIHLIFIITELTIKYYKIINNCINTIW